MNNYKNESVFPYWQFQKRQERGYTGRRKFTICPKMELDYIPFKLFALMAYGVTDVMAIGEFKRTIMWMEYRVACVELGVDYQTSRLFGLYED